MSVIWYKVWSDLWDNKVRTLLAVLSIAAGVFSIGTIFGMNDQLVTGMDTAHQSIIPCHIRLYLIDRIDRDIADRLQHIKGVDKIELVNAVGVRYKLKPEDEWKAGNIVMRYDYNNIIYERLQLKSGQWPDKNKLAVERLSGQFFNINIGDKVIFEMNGSDRILSVGGIVRDSFVEPPMFGGAAAFFIGEKGLERFGVADGEFGELLIRVKPYSAEFAKEVASKIKDNLAKEGVDVAVSFYQDPNEHWGRRFVMGQNLILEILAVVSLFMSVILVLNTLTAVITQQTAQIGIIKAIGGTTDLIVKIYLAGVLVYGLLALFISLPLGAYLAFGMTQQFLNMFNIDYDTFQISNRTIVLQVAAAIAGPLLAALWPVLSGSMITVREAIASYGLGGNFGQNSLDRFVEQMGQRFLSGPYAMALGNIFRRKGRFILTQLVLVTAGAMFLVIMSLSASVKFTLDNFLARRNYDMQINFDGNERIDQVLQVAKSLDGVEEADVWFVQAASILKEGQRAKEAGIGAFLTAIPVEHGMFAPSIAAGRWLKRGDGQVIVISETAANDNNIYVGDTVTVNLGKMGKDDWQVVGIFQTVLGGGFDVDPIYAPQDVVFRITPKHNVGSQLYVRTRSHVPTEVDAVMAKLKNMYEYRKMDLGERSQTTHEFREFVDSQFAMTINMLLALAIIVATVGGIGLMGSLSISVVERTKEIGVMRAIGAQTPIIMGMFVMEGVLQGVFSWAMAVPLSLMMGQPVTNALGKALEINLDYQYNVQAVIYWLIAILVISVLASILPARNATRVSVSQSLAYA